MLRRKIFFLVLMLIIFTVPVFAGKVELTTYYPSPTGEYDSLQAKKVATGDTNANGVIDSGDLPNRDGDLRLVPQSGNPTSWPTTGLPTGQIAYSSANDALYHFNGSNWVSSGGSSGGPIMVFGTPTPGTSNQQADLACPAGYIITACGAGRCFAGASYGPSTTAAYAYMGIDTNSGADIPIPCGNWCFGAQLCTMTNWGGSINMLAKCEKPGT